MSRGNTDAFNPQEPARSPQTDFGPHQFENGARRVEQGIAAGQGTQALHEELSLMRDAAMQNGTFNLAQYKADVKAIDAQLHKDGFLPHIHLDVDGQGKDVVKRGGDQTEAAPESSSEPRGRGHGRGHGRRHGRGGGGGHHGRRHGRHAGRGAETSSNGEQSEEGGQVASGHTLTDQEMRPDVRSADRMADRMGDRTGDPSADRSFSMRGDDRSSYNMDPNKDRSARPGEPSIWGPPTISAQGIDKVLRDNHSPAAGMGSYIYDQAVERGINPAFALAMYGQESTFGTKGAAARNHSFGNIRAGHGFKHYPDVKAGIDDWMRLMGSDAYHGKSLSGVIHKYAPGSDGNNPRGYMAYVTNNMNKWSRMGDDTERRYA